MSSLTHRAARATRRGILLAGLGLLAACGATVGGGPLINTRNAVPVALLAPYGSGDARTEALAQSLENAARMALADLDGAEIDLRVYNTGGSAQAAAQAAREAVNGGAKIIIGPLFAESANAAGKAVAGRGVSVLSFSNNPEIAGGNVYLLGNTFENAADRLLRYGTAQGRNRVMVVHAQNLAGRIGQRAVERAAARTGATLTGTASYEFSQQGVVDAIGPIVEQATQTDTNAIVFTSDSAGALPILTQLLPENGVGPEEVQFMGLTRWDIPAQTLALPGVQGGWFTMPDPGLASRFEARYAQAFGQAPHPLAGLAYDGIAAIGALIKTGGAGALGAEALTQPSGFAGVNGVFRFRRDGTNERALAIAQIQNSEVTILDPAPRSFGAAGL
ncbi:penicillin-binding protein activator [Maritimibacter sp. 55A14]|uniref:penicillin-binding protein activator n=1 Tax=Maritimibacter sp. 55A14 TaxID=2174844 RepID=UPI000D6075C8|nr:penicillin-binding protein activator [Maritimibacter sp. 55A14]PWE31152.1 penicillin-binding protein activator [Maritimibacter sp. 55A14]